MNERIPYLFLSVFSTVAAVERIRRAVETAGSPEAFLGSLPDETVFPMNEEQRTAFEQWKDPARLAEFLARMEDEGIRYVPESAEDYPYRLFDLNDGRPFGIFVRGRLPDPNDPAVALVGSRRPSPYGREMAEFFGEALASGGVNVISGLALGVDGHAGRGAVKQEFRSFAVLGNGPDICYPPANLDLFEDLKERGGILSERPPGYYAKTYDFPIRNRLISALSDAVAVIEGAENSGSLITADYALDLNRTVFALPGRITDRTSAGCNRLIKNGAEILTCPEDVLQYLGLNVKEDTKREKKTPLEPREELVFRAVSESHSDVESLLVRTGLPVTDLLETLVCLEIRGIIRKEEGGVYSPVR